MALQCYGSVNHELENAPSRPTGTVCCVSYAPSLCFARATFHFSLPSRQHCILCTNTNQILSDKELLLHLIALLKHLEHVQSVLWITYDRVGCKSWQSWRQSWCRANRSSTSSLTFSLVTYMQQGLAGRIAGLLCTLHFSKDILRWWNKIIRLFWCASIPGTTLTDSRKKTFHQLYDEAFILCLSSLKILRPTMAVSFDVPIQSALLCQQGRLGSWVDWLIDIDSTSRDMDTFTVDICCCLCLVYRHIGLNIS